MKINTKLDITKLKFGDKLIDSEMRQHTYIGQSECWVFTIHMANYDNVAGECEYANTWRKPELRNPFDWGCILFDYADNITDELIRQKRKNDKLKMFHFFDKKENLLAEYKALIENDKVEL